MTPDDLQTIAGHIRQLTDVLDVWLIDRPASPFPDRLDLLTAMIDLSKRTRDVTNALHESVGSDLGDEPIQHDGRWWEKKPERVTRGWKRDDMRDRVTACALVTEDGELRDAREAVDAMWAWVDVATGRSAKLRAIGITPDEYATETGWQDRVKEITP